jgi:starch synthase (maltosyl-transferring)
MSASKPIMLPGPGTRLQRFAGDSIRFEVSAPSGRPENNWRALLRTNLGRAALLRREILEAHTRGLPLGRASWRDIPMQPMAEGWFVEMPVAEIGYFKAKPYLLGPSGWQVWPEGPDVGISIHPDRYRTANTIYCAFARAFGATKQLRVAQNEKTRLALAPFDQEGYTIIPPSGKLRDLTAALPHILGTLGCRILHLLPVNPTPTTYARFGRYGSPYAALDLTAIDPALVVFDKRTTGIDQFRELTYETHLRGGRVFLDIVINHTGWGSTLQENHPEWFLRQSDGAFASPGAWSVTWEDLVELKHDNVALWDELAEVFLTWCQRGVDGFRCDAGYKVPVAAWQYIIARVQQQYPETIFLLEGLGGAWETTEALLTEGGMQWAYSELFQNYSALQVAGYLDHSLKQSRHVGMLVHYSETHDNDRLAARGRVWSLLRNRLCALAGVNGGFGFACGVEWLATEKIQVHGCTGLAWDNPENLVPELARLNELLNEHPCFFDGATVTRLSPAASPMLVLLRQSEEGKDVVLVILNTDQEKAHPLLFEKNPAALSTAEMKLPKEFVPESIRDFENWHDLLSLASAAKPALSRASIAAGAAFCLSPTLVPQGLHGNAYRRARAQAAWGISALHEVAALEKAGALDWRALAQQVDRSPAEFLASISSPLWPSGRAANPQSAQLKNQAKVHPLPFIRGEGRGEGSELAHLALFPNVITWTLLDVRRIIPVPPGHWLLLQDTAPFRVSLNFIQPHFPAENVESIAAGSSHIACFPPRQNPADATLSLERYTAAPQHVRAEVRFLPALPSLAVTGPLPTDVVLLTNGRGGMARMCVDLGRIHSKYDCVLGANLHPTLPVDRHILAKRLRVWVNADGFISPLDFKNLAHFESGPLPVWRFVAYAGDGRAVAIQMSATMPENQNATIFEFSRAAADQPDADPEPACSDVRLTVRLDIEDRGYHSETKRNGGADHHFSSNTRSFPQPKPGAAEKIGFEFCPARDRRLQVWTDTGFFHSQAEWSENIPHPIEQSRGQVGSGDAYSPGWFEIPLPQGATAKLIVSAETAFEIAKTHSAETAASEPVSADAFTQQLLAAVRTFVVRRGEGKTVIAGYPWFLDWGRDTFISARGLLAAGMAEEVKKIVLTFARFEKDGTLPNTIFGEDASNRDTSDAPLWFGVVCEELEPLLGPVHEAGPALYSIANNYVRGTPNGIRMDPASGLIWSPSHFTWMDTNYPAATPREGYPIEIQVLWIRLLRHLARISPVDEAARWQELAARALDSLEKCFWSEKLGYYADLLVAKAGQPAASATMDDALRSNCLFAISLGLAQGERARRCVEAARRYLVVPGGLRSLAPLPLEVPLPVRGPDGRLLNNPKEPYWGHYEGDEDTRRKPAYHNGTAWTWTFPVFCEAFARAWDFAPEAVAAARAYLGSMARTMQHGCIGQLPEIMDGDAPHTPRGCDAQAWGATEALRVWQLLAAAS